MKKSKMPAPRRAGTAKSRMLAVITALVGRPEDLEAWLRAGEARCRRRSRRR